VGWGPMRDDARLVTDAVAGDGAAFGELAERWFDRCWEVAWRILHDRDLAADVAQDALVTAWRRLDGLDRPASFGGWVLRIARNRALDRLERERRTVAIGDEAPFERGDTSVATPEAALMRTEAGDLVWAAAAALGERDASLLDLHLRHGLEPAEVAAELGIAPNAAHQALFRLRRRLGDAVRAWLLWRGGEPNCVVLRAELAAAGTTSFGQPVVRHVLDHAAVCRDCAAERDRCTAPAAMFSAVPFVAAPLAAREQALDAVLAAVAGGGSGDPDAEVFGAGDPDADRGGSTGSDADGGDPGGGHAPGAGDRGSAVDAGDAEPATTPGRGHEDGDVAGTDVPHVVLPVGASRWVLALLPVVAVLGFLLWPGGGTPEPATATAASVAMPVEVPGGPATAPAAPPTAAEPNADPTSELPVLPPDVGALHPMPVDRSPASGTAGAGSDAAAAVADDGTDDAEGASPAGDAAPQGPGGETSGSGPAPGVTSEGDGGSDVDGDGNPDAGGADPGPDDPLPADEPTPSPPTIGTFTHEGPLPGCDPVPGQAPRYRYVLQWATEHAEVVTLDVGDGPQVVPAAGTVEVCAPLEQQVTLVATNEAGSDSRSIVLA
jgi:RNA polymerase sigma factor (sigma-70 family)